MNTKTCAFLAVALIVNSYALGQPEITGAKWNVTIKVVDSILTPVEGAKVSVGYTALRRPGQIVSDLRELGENIKGLTGDTGIFKASHTDASWTLGIDAQKDG